MLILNSNIKFGIIRRYFKTFGKPKKKKKKLIAKHVVSIASILRTKHNRETRKFKFLLMQQIQFKKK
ncbi:hypothetical protein BpHYR1_026388 [Brachionus plicatilis]|uniref:Uncharacterized protein n=1 Tax=Brachionus plicatilis TaxID=10195 RepID=A0A3M7SUY7_BRAPC|nr:hypothetical protein BpHYR1_026388 [Brachionus plicatilis]